MKINTRKFGEVEVGEDKIFRMPAGMLGFPGRELYTLLERTETRPFCWLQCVDDPDLAMVVLNPFLFKPDYSVDLKAALREMDWPAEDEEKLLLFVVINTWEGEPERITANLIGPVVLNPVRQEAFQMVMADSPYSHQHDVLER